MAQAERTSMVPAHVPASVVRDFDIYGDPRVNGDVQQSYAEALADFPDVFFTPRNGGHWIVRRLKDINDILVDPVHFSSSVATIPRVENPPYLIPFSIDPPEHFGYRKVLREKFSAQAVRALEPRIRHWASELITDVASRDSIDFINDISSRFPVLVFMELMGMPFDRLREFRAIVDDNFRCKTNEEYAAVIARIYAIMNDLLDLRSRQPADDLVSSVLRAKIDDRLLSRKELLGICHLLFLGGMDTVTNVLGFSYRHLAGDAALQERLETDPGAIPSFVNEAIRCFGTANSVRIVKADCERFGVKFRVGDMVLGALPLAGRDDRVNAEPHRFDIDRPANLVSHLTFSGGIHLCLGHILARTEIRIFTEEWVKRIPRFRLADPHRDSITFRIGLVHAIETLPVRLDHG